MLAADSYVLTVLYSEQYHRLSYTPKWKCQIRKKKLIFFIDSFTGLRRCVLRVRFHGLHLWYTTHVGYVLVSTGGCSRALCPLFTLELSAQSHAHM